MNEFGVINFNSESNEALNQILYGKVGDIIDYILIDLSGGRGKEMDIEIVGNIYEKIIASKYKNEVGFAGGLSGENVGEMITYIHNRINSFNFSIDAEQKLRDADDNLILENVKNYITNYMIAKGEG